MTKRQAAGFFFGGTGAFLALFVGLTIHSHTRFPELTHEENLDETALAGQDVWHHGNCVNCHTLLGEGAYYAPDLTKITDLRGEVYLAQFLAEPTLYYSEQENGRIMPNPQLTAEEIREVIAFLGWIGGIENSNWPPRPILVSGTAFPGVPGGAAAGPASEDPVALGEALFRSSPPACFSCHSTSPGIILAGPSVAGVATRAREIIQDPNYRGAATTPEGFVRESILQPSAYINPGSSTFSAAGQSIMPGNYEETLTSDDVDHLVAYLMTLR
jgi:nitric oxide reductase subunit C